jgi:hypothetical protein
VVIFGKRARISAIAALIVSSVQSAAVAEPGVLEQISKIPCEQLMPTPDGYDNPYRMPSADWSDDAFDLLISRVLECRGNTPETRGFIRILTENWQVMISENATNLQESGAATRSAEARARSEAAVLARVEEARRKAARQSRRNVQARKEVAMREGVTSERKGDEIQPSPDARSAQQESQKTGIDALIENYPVFVWMLVVYAAILVAIFLRARKRSRRKSVQASRLSSKAQRGTLRSPSRK